MIFMKNKPCLAHREDYEDIRRLWDETFEEDSPEWRDWYFNNIYEPQNCFILRKKGILVSMSHMNPYPMMLNSKKIKASALAGVATAEDERGKGHAARLIKLCLNEMRKRGESLSFLYPFNYDFYRKYGYELCYQNDIYTAHPGKKSDLRVKKDCTGYMAAQIYAKYAKPLNGYIIRSEEYQIVKFREYLEDGGSLYSFILDGSVIGYALAEDKKDIAHVGELVSSKVLSCAQALANELGKPVEYMSAYTIEEAEAKSKPHCMARITDIPGVFNGIAAKEHRIVIKVCDDIIKENNANFAFESSAGTLSVTTTDEKQQATLQIKELAAIALGYEKSMSAQAKQIYSAFFEAKKPWIVEVC